MYSVTTRLLAAVLILLCSRVSADDVFIPDGFLSARKELGRSDLSESDRSRYERLLNIMPLSKTDYVIDVLFKPIDAGKFEGVLIVEQDALGHSAIDGFFESIAEANVRAALALKSNTAPEVKMDERFFSSHGAYRADVLNPYGKTDFMMSYLIFPRGARQLLVIITAPNVRAPAYENLLDSMFFKS